VVVETPVGVLADEANDVGGTAQQLPSQSLTAGFELSRIEERVVAAEAGPVPASVCSDERNLRFLNEFAVGDSEGVSEVRH